MYEIFTETRKRRCLMRISMIYSLILIGGFQLLFASNSRGQNLEEIIVTIKPADKNLEHLLKDIELQTHLTFAYLPSDVRKYSNIGLQPGKQSVKTALDKALVGTELSYRYVENSIIIFPRQGIDMRKAPVLTPGERSNDISMSSSSRTAGREVVQALSITTPLKIFERRLVRSVSGRVIDSEGEPLIGVNIQVKGSSKGTATDFDGNFVLEDIDENAVLVISYIGYQTQEIVVRGKSNIEIVMVSDSQLLDEVVVVGYGTQKKSDLSGSVVRIDQRSIENRPNLSILQSLKGLAPGLNIGQINTSGEEASISIRGQNSLSGSNSPLIVLDNVIFKGNLNDINPHDIESIDILKDASSTAVYGSQASNGVLLITTKNGGSGGNGDVKISLFSSYSFDRPTNLLGVENNNEFIKRIVDADLFNSRTEASDYLDENPNYNKTSNFRTNEQVDAFRNESITDWNKLLTNRKMHSQNHNVSISNSFENSNYLVSFGFADQKGYMVNEAYKRYNMRINLQNHITEWFKIGLQSFMVTSDFSGETVQSNSIYLHHPYSPAFSEDGTLLENPNGLDINPLFVFDGDDYQKEMNLSGIINAEINIPYVEGLSIRTNLSTNYLNNKNYFYHPYENSFQGGGEKYIDNNKIWATDYILSYNREFNDRHFIDLTLLYGVEASIFESTTSTSSAFTRDILGYNKLEIGDSDLQKVGSQAWKESSLYNMGRIVYRYKGKYITTGTIRRDGFSGFGANNKFGIFPSISFAWVISEEGFLRANDQINLLKLRASFGTNGNRTIGRYETIAKLNGGFNYLDDNKSSLYTQSIVELANPDLKWEKTTGFNFGIDFMLFNEKLYGEIELYNTNTRDLLYNVDIPGVSRYESFPTNLGLIHNNGIELSLNSRNISKEGFIWNSQFIFSRNRNKIKELIGFDKNNDGIEDDVVSANLFIGEPIESIYDYEVLNNGDLWQLGDEIPSSADLGSYKIVDQNNDGKIDPQNDRKILGYRTPSFRFGIDNHFEYKKWTFNIFINSAIGNNNYYLGEDNIQDFNVINSNISYTYSFPPGLDYWLPENPNSKYQKLLINVPSNSVATRYTSRSFVRIQNIRLSYDFNNWIFHNSNIDESKIFVSLTNPFVFTKWPGWDPETGEGIIKNGKPVLKSYNFGIRITI